LKKDRPFVIGLTGVIGTGKSRVAATLVSLGAEAVDADRVAHEVMQPGGPAFEPVVAAFGREIIGPDGAIDRQRLGRLVFSDPAALARLEALVHPAVHAAISRRIARSSAPAFVIEAIKLLEAGLSASLCDRVWVTAASPARQRERLKASRGMTAAEVRQRMAHQMPPDEMARASHRVIDTDGTMAETDLAVLAGWAELSLPLPEPRIRPGKPDDAEGIAATLNSVVAERNLTVIDRKFTPAQERRFLARLPDRSFLTVAELGCVIAGFQVVEPYAAAAYTGAMAHVASLGSYVVRSVRGRGLGRALSAATFAAARGAGYAKLVIQVRGDNPAAQGFYERLGFRQCGVLARQALIDGCYIDETLYELFL
jgi:dephospho-CoA kinase